jgi:hypothetical protein
MLRIYAAFRSFNLAFDRPKHILTDKSEPDSNQDFGFLSITVDITQFLFHLLPSAIFHAVRHKRKTRYLIETAGFYLVAGARFELTTFRL